MNTKLYTTLLEQYRNYCQVHVEKIAEKRQEYQLMNQSLQALTSDILAALTEEGFYQIIAPLWSMAMWGNKHYKINQIVAENGMEVLREELHNLLHGTTDIAQRWDRFRTHVKGIGPATISELLNKFQPKEYILWNNKALSFFQLLEISKTPKSMGQTDGQQYATLCKKGLELVAIAQKRSARKSAICWG